MRFLHISPHSDDEALAAPATLIHLLRSGHRVDNLLLSLGQDPERRLREAREAHSRSGINLIVAHGDLQEELQKYRPDVWIGPQPQDGHPWHEAVGRAIRNVLRPGEIWWQWGLWADLAVPNIFHGWGEDTLQQAIWALRAYEGEVSRNDYVRLLEAKSKAMSHLGPERVFGWGSRGSREPYGEVLREVIRTEEGWAGARGRSLAPLEFPAPVEDLTDIVMQPSPAEMCDQGTFWREAKPG